MTQLQCFLLGPPQIRIDHCPVDLGRRKALALLAYLVIDGQHQSRDSLAALLWPEYSQRDARTDLSRTLSYLNRTLGEGWLIADRQRIGVDPESELWVDVGNFRQLVSQGEIAHENTPEEQKALLMTAAERYQGDFMAGFSLSDSPAFNDWHTLQTQALQLQLGQVLERLSELHTAEGAYDLAIAAAQRWLKLNLLHEPVHRQLMLLYALTDQQSVALRQYRDCERILKEELGIGPDAATIELLENIKSGQVSTLLVDSANESASQSDNVAAPTLESPILRSPTVPQPDEPTLFVGRQHALTRLDAFLQKALTGQGHVVFITGEAGAGKTALVSEFIQRSQRVHPDLLVTYGNCNAQTDIGDPYLPFRELLAMLTGDSSVARGTEMADEERVHYVSDENEARLHQFLPEFGRILVKDGPELLDRLVSSNGLAQSAAQLASQKLT